MEAAMNEAYGHRYYVLDWEGSRFDEALVAIQALPNAAFDRYENPFEAKWTLRDKFRLPEEVDVIVRNLEQAQKSFAQQKFFTRIERDTSRHYCGVFRYEPGDFLKVHVDAGIHPTAKKRKQVTAILYLGEADGGDLELWSGTDCTDEDPRVLQCIARIKPKHGRFVFFENNDFAWHGVRPITGSRERVVVTVSYLYDGAVNEFRNMRERAFFVPRPGEHWSQETLDLRDKRADSQQYAEAYKSNVAARM